MNVNANANANAKPNAKPNQRCVLFNFFLVVGCFCFSGELAVSPV